MPLKPFFKHEIMSKQETAINKFDSGYNCAQSVLTPFVRQMNIDVDLALKLASGFGAGMGRTQNTCGALTGAYMVLGLAYGKQYPDHNANDKVAGFIQVITQRFKKTHGSTDCRDLLKVDLKTEEGQKSFTDNKLHDKVCARCVEGATKLLEELIDPPFTF